MGHSNSQLNLQPGEVAVFGYGSLLNMQSLSATLGRKYTGPLVPSHLDGYTRLWNCSYPNQRYRAKTSGGPVSPQKILYLNIEPQPGAAVNGVIVILQEEDLRFLDEREAVYDRIDVTEAVRDIEITGGKVFTYVSKPEHIAPSSPIFPEMGLRQSYIEIVNAALVQYDPCFGEEFRSTTAPIPRKTVFEDYLEE